MSALRYFSTFTGVGGLDIGLEEAGAKCVGFSEIRESSIAIYKRHYPDHVNFGDITKIDPKTLPDFDVFTGSFPCQSFSMAGVRKGFGDRRGQMIFYIHDILEEKKPKYVVLENVKGILNHDGGKTVKNVIATLQLAGYKIRILHLNASRFGSAQARDRIVFICRLGEDFPAVNPEATDSKKRFRDVRDEKGPYRFVSETVLSRIEGSGKWVTLVGGYDLVNTLTTNESSCGKDRLYTQEKDGRFRKLTILEGERLQCFPEGWTDVEGISASDRWFAIGNAVNMAMSRYLFGKYLKDLWGI